MLRRVAVVAMLLANTTAATSSTTAAETSALGIGDTTCSAMTAAVEENPALEFLYMGWVQGFMSSLNVEQAQQSRRRVNLHPSALPPAKQRDTFRGWCAANPGESLAKGALLFYVAARIEQGLDSAKPASNRKR